MKTPAHDYLFYICENTTHNLFACHENLYCSHLSDDMVLDACSSPGNKATLIAATCRALVCCERNEKRLGRSDC